MTNWEVAHRLAYREEKLRYSQEQEDPANIITGWQKLVEESQEALEQNEGAKRLLEEAREYAKVFVVRGRQISENSLLGRLQNNCTFEAANLAASGIKDGDLFQDASFDQCWKVFLEALRDGNQLRALNALFCMLSEVRAEFIGELELPPLPRKR